MQRARLITRSVPRIVAHEVLPDYEWQIPCWLELFCPSATLERREAVSAENPSRMLFVFERETDELALPSESGVLHMRELEASRRVLAPWAIDTATDVLFEARVAAETVFSLATDSLRGVFWGLHDWAHFHSHGPFERIAETELQCDLAALAWTWDNRAVLTLTDDEYRSLLERVEALWRQRFAVEARACDFNAAWSVLETFAGVPRSLLPPVARG